MWGRNTCCNDEVFIWFLSPDCNSAGLQGFLTDWCRNSFPSLPDDAVAAIVSHLTGSEVMCHVARNLAVEELAMTAEFPVPDDVLRGTFFAVIGALEQSSGSERAGHFVRVRLAVMSGQVLA